MTNPQITTIDKKKANLFQNGLTSSTGMPTTATTTKTEKALFGDSFVKKGGYTGAFSGLEKEVKTGNSGVKSLSGTTSVDTGSVWSSVNYTSSEISDLNNSIFSVKTGATRAENSLPTKTTSNSEAATKAAQFISNAQALAGEASSLMQQAAQCESSQDYVNAEKYYQKAMQKADEARAELQNAYADGDQATLLQVSANIAKLKTDSRDKMYAMSAMNYNPNGTSSSSEKGSFWGNLGNQLAQALSSAGANAFKSSGSSSQAPNKSGGTTSPEGSSSSTQTGNKQLKVDSKYDGLKEVQDAKAKFSEATSQIATANAEKTAGKSELKTAEAEKGSLEDEIDDLDGTREDVAEDYMDLKNKESEYIQEANKQQAIVTENQKLSREYGNQISQKQNSELPQAEREVTEQDSALKTATAKVVKAEGELNQLKSQLSSAKTDEDKRKIENLIRSKQIDVENLKARETQAKKDLEIAQNKVEKIKEEIKELQTAKADVDKIVSEAEKEMKIAQGKAKELEPKIKEQAKLVQQIETKKDNLLGRINETFKKINNAQAKIDTADAQISAQRDRQETAQDLADIAIDRAQVDEQIQNPSIGNWFKAKV